MLVAGRDDGLGARLMALLNAWSITNHYGATSVGYLWPTLEADTLASFRTVVAEVGELADLLAPETLQRLFEVSDLPTRTFDPATAAEAAVSSTDHMLCQHWAGVYRLPNENEAAALARFRNDVQLSMFHPAIAQVVKDIAPRLGGATAIHVRRGDILKERIFGLKFINTKYLTRFHFEQILEEQQAEGDVVIFTDSRERLDDYADGQRVRFAEDLIPSDLDVAQSNLAEVLLMSQCASLRGAGMSMFSQLAAAIGTPTYAAQTPGLAFTERSYRHPPEDDEWLLDCIGVVEALLERGKAPEAAMRASERDQLFPEVHLGMLLRFVLTRRHLRPTTPLHRTALGAFFHNAENRRCLARISDAARQVNLPCAETAARMLRHHELPVRGMRSLLDGFLETAT